MASADCPRPLGQGALLGSVWCLSAHVAEFYRMLLDDLWALLLLASSPRHPASLLVRVPATKRSLPALSTAALRPRPSLQLRLASPPPSGSFHPDSSPHLPSTRARRSRRINVKIPAHETLYPSSPASSSRPFRLSRSDHTMVAMDFSPWNDRPNRTPASRRDA